MKIKGRHGLSRNAQVLRYILGVAPGVGRTKLLKFAYLADCEARRYLGRPISEFGYIRYDQGPFDQAFYKAVEELESAKLIDVSRVTFPNGYEGYCHRPTQEAVEYHFSPGESAVLDFVATTYWNVPARDLCDDVVYETEPMKSGVEMNKALPMGVLDKPKDDLFGFNLERLLASEESARSGKHRPVTEAMDAILATPHSGS